MVQGSGIVHSAKGRVVGRGVPLGGAGGVLQQRSTHWQSLSEEGSPSGSRARSSSGRARRRAGRRGRRRERTARRWALRSSENGDCADGKDGEELHVAERVGLANAMSCLTGELSLILVLIFYTRVRKIRRYVGSFSEREKRRPAQRPQWSSSSPHLATSLSTPVNCAIGGPNAIHLASSKVISGLAIATYLRSHNRTRLNDEWPWSANSILDQPPQLT